MNHMFFYSIVFEHMSYNILFQRCSAVSIFLLQVQQAEGHVRWRVVSFELLTNYIDLAVPFGYVLDWGYNTRFLRI